MNLSSPSYVFPRYAHQLPPLILRAAVAATLVIEIPLTIMLISPFLIMRRFGVIFQFILQLSIIVTGNYNFFNLLTIALAIKCWENDLYAECADSAQTNASSPILVRISTKKDFDKHSNFSEEDIEVVDADFENEGPIVFFIKGFYSVVKYFENSLIGKTVIACCSIGFFVLSFYIMIYIESITGSSRKSGSKFKIDFYSFEIRLLTSYKDLKKYIQPFCMIAFGEHSSSLFSLDFLCIYVCVLKVHALDRRLLAAYFNWVIFGIGGTVEILVVANDVFAPFLSLLQL